MISNDPPGRGGKPARGHDRDADGAVSVCHPPGRVPWVDERDRVDDFRVPGPRPQRRTVADEQMALRWCAAAMVGAGKKFRRVNAHLPAPRTALDREATVVRTDRASAA